MRRFLYRFLVPLVLAPLIGSAWSSPVQAQDQVQALVEPAWLKSRLTDKSLVILDLRQEGEYQSRHIPGAIWSPYPEASWYFRPAMGAPSPGVQNALAARMGQLGITARSHVILVHAGRLYNHPAYAAQVYWTFKYAGHKQLSILHGGMQSYLLEPGAPVTTQPAAPAKGSYYTDPGDPSLALIQDVRAAIAAKSQIVDVRARGQFLGINKIDEVDRYGTIPGALHIPAAWLTIDGGGRLRSASELNQIFQAMKIDGNAEIVFISDTGTLSALGWFAAFEMLGNRKARNYAPGLREWARDPNNTMERRFTFK